MPEKVIIIGAGIGGIASAALLAKRGYEVVVYDEHDKPGGRAGKLEIDGFTFDTGPSWYLMPEVFAHFYELMGERVEDWLSLTHLSPAYKVFFEHKDPITIYGDLQRDMKTFDVIEPGAGMALQSYVRQSSDTYKLSLGHFLYTNFERLRDYAHLDILRRLHRLPSLLLTSIDSFTHRYVRDKRLNQILQYPMVFLGTSPFTAPAMYSLMSALDFEEGVFFPKGGMYEIIESLVAIAKKHGVTFYANAGVTEIITRDGTATGVRLKGGRIDAADIIISNADLHFTETELLTTKDRTYTEGYWSKREAGPSALLMYLGVKGTLPTLEHHNLLFVDSWKENFESLYDSKEVPEKASLYVSKITETQKDMAPKGHENIFVLVPLPAETKLDEKETEALAEHFIKQIYEATGADLRNTVVRRIFAPQQFGDSFHSWQYSMLGQSHLLKQSAFFRTPNASKKVKNLYYVGGSTVPGIGLPMCLIGAELVYKRIVGIKKAGRVESI